MSEYIEHIRKHLYGRFGKNIEIVDVREGAWNKRYHVEADIVVESNKLPLFLKGLWPETQEAELYAYNCVLPLLGVRVPHFYGGFPDTEPGRQWIILERVAGRWVNLGDKEEALSVFKMMGYIHGVSKMSPPSREHPAVDQLMFPAEKDEREFSNRRHLLQEHAVELGIDKEVIEVFGRNILYLRESPRVWIHGDNDRSNMLINDDGPCFIDWEKLAWAPPALDLGQIATIIPGTPPDQITEHLQAYCSGFRESSGELLELDQVSEWTQHGIFFDGVRWICYYCERMDDDNWDRQNWYDTYLVPIIASTNSMIRDGKLV